MRLQIGPELLQIDREGAVVITHLVALVGDPANRRVVRRRPCLSLSSWNPWWSVLKRAMRASARSRGDRERDASNEEQSDHASERSTRVHDGSWSELSSVLVKSQKRVP